MAPNSGDLHGQYPDLLRIFTLEEHPPTTKFLFLGNYVSRGRQSIEIMCLLMAYKIKYPHSIYLLRGPHETSSISRVYGFYDECKRRFNIKLWKEFTKKCFDCLPLAALVGQKVFCCRGGMSPVFDSMDTIRSISRPADCPDQGLFCDLIWSDPDEQMKGFRDGDRGISYNYGPDVVFEFMQKYDLSLIVRGRHPQNFYDGYTYMADNKLISLMSAPDFHGFGCKAAILSLEHDLTHTIQILEPVRNIEKEKGSQEKINTMTADQTTDTSSSKSPGS